MKIVFEVVVFDDHADGSRWATFSLSREGLEIIKSLEAMVKGSSLLKAITAHIHPESWDGEDDYGIKEDGLVITPNWAFFTSYQKHTDVRQETRRFSVGELEKVLEVAEGAASPESLPPEFAIRHGITFYGEGNLRVLMDEYCNEMDELGDVVAA